MKKLTAALVSFVITGSASADLSFEPKPIPTPLPQPKSNAVHFTASNHVALTDDINGPSIANTMVKLAALKTAQPILFISSPGGSVDAGMRLVDMIVSSPREITCVAYYAASMAFVIFQACHKRYVMVDSTLMQHQSFFAAKGQEANLKKFTNYVFRIIDKINNAQAKRMKMTLEAFNEARHDDLWLYGEDALTYKAADALVSTSCTEDLLLETRKETIQTWFGEVALEYSKCPFIVDPIKIDFKSVYSDKEKQALYEQFMGNSKKTKPQPAPMFQEYNVKNSSETQLPSAKSNNTLQ